MMLRFFIFIFLITACSKTNKQSEEKLLGDWYGGHGEKYQDCISKKTFIQFLPAGNQLFQFGKDHIFYHSAANTRMKYQWTKNKIYFDTDKAELLRYYTIEKFKNDSLVVLGPYKDNKQLYTKDCVLYRLRYYRKR